MLQKEKTMNKSDRAVLKAAIDKYGQHNRLAQTQEECAELIQAISKLNRSEDSDHPGRAAKAALNHLMEETVDVQIMLEQIRIMFPSKAYDSIRAQKITRLEKRMKK